MILLKRWVTLSSDGTQYGIGRLAGFTLIMVVAFSLLSPNAFFSSINAQSIAFGVPEAGILALCMMIAMVTAGIDLSIVSISNLSAIAAASVFVRLGDGSGGPASLLLGLTAGVVVGVLCGVINGLLIAHVRITPILATLGTLVLFEGAAYVWTGGRALYGFPDSFLWVGSGLLLGVPVSLVVLGGLAAAVALLLSRTALGVRMTLIGASSDAARYSGIRQERVLVWTYALSGGLAAVAGLLIATRTASASPDYGTSYLLLAIVIAVLGGANPAGGNGSVLGVLLAALCLQVLGSGLNIVGLNPYWYQVAQGVILTVALALNLREHKRRPPAQDDHPAESVSGNKGGESCEQPSFAKN